MELFRNLVATPLVPFGVLLQDGLNKQFCLNTILTLLGHIPGIVRADQITARE